MLLPILPFCFIFFTKHFKETALFTFYQAAVCLLLFFKMLLCFLWFIMVSRVIQHSRAQAVLTFFHGKNVVVNTAFAACPESLVLRKLAVGNRLITQLAIDFHYCQSGS